ncbi:hypothetical protein HRbin15_00307 [bacterium HR15]|nr:hypothetical protein HRbin15_00307 [bacterium HR15]
MEKTHEVKTNQLSPKQGVAIGVLSLILVSVGVWQWRSMSGHKPSARPGSTAPSGQVRNTPASTTPSGQAEVSASFAPFPARDPFRPTVAVMNIPNRVAQPAKTSAKSPVRAITGTPPVPPLALPAPGGLEVKQVEKPEPPPVPNWTLVGVVQGPRTIAILKDSEGNRRFVQMGDKLEDGWRIRRIERGKLTLQNGQRTISIHVGGSTAESKVPPDYSTGGMQQ